MVLCEYMNRGRSQLLCSRRLVVLMQDVLRWSCEVWESGDVRWEG